MQHGHAEPGRHLGDCRANTSTSAVIELGLGIPVCAAILSGYRQRVIDRPTQRTVLHFRARCIDPGQLNGEANPGGPCGGCRPDAGIGR